MLKSRSGSQGSSAATPPQTIEVVRRRARHRLIGAAILVLVGVLGFPLLFDTEPRQVAGDIPIEIPSRNDATVVAKADVPVAKEAPALKEKPSVSGKADAPVTPTESLDAREEVVEPVAPSEVETAQKKADSQEAAKDAAKEKAKEQAAKEQARVKEAQQAAAAAAKAKSDAAAADSARAKALLEAKAPPGANLRLVVQVGAFADPNSARATRLKLERAGMTTYTHVADTASGKLIRVRVGPYPSRAEADKAAAKVKALGLPARILEL